MSLDDNLIIFGAKVQLPAGLPMVVETPVFGWCHMAVKANDGEKLVDIDAGRFFIENDLRLKRTDFCGACKDFILTCHKNGHIPITWPLAKEDGSHDDDKPGCWALILKTELEAAGILAQVEAIHKQRVN